MNHFEGMRINVQIDQVEKRCNQNGASKGDGLSMMSFDGVPKFFLQIW